MRTAFKIAVIAGSLILTACTVNPYTGEQQAARYLLDGPYGFGENETGR